ncbi:MAG: hypothetical protein J6X67_13985 [Treponema sp.]|nr:hypothetical protein [Treponema sp.]
MKNTFFCPLPSVRLFAGVAAALCVALCCLSFFSCSANDDSGSLSIVMPGSSPSRSITSENPGGMGLSAGASVDGYVFSVYIRDSNNDEVEKYTGVRPGAKLTIDQLRAGKYNIAIRCISLSSGTVGFYGTAQADVKGGTENTVSIKMEFLNSNSLTVLFHTSVAGGSLSYYTPIRLKATCKNGDSYSIEGYLDPATSWGPNYNYFYTAEHCFFEPGFTYTINISLYNDSDSELVCTLTRSFTATSDSNVVKIE